MKTTFLLKIYSTIYFYYYMYYVQASLVKDNLVNFLDYKNTYCVAYNFWKSSLELTPEKPRITLVLHSTFNYLYHLENQISIWEGLISVALFIRQPKIGKCFGNKKLYCSLQRRNDLLYYQVLKDFKNLFDTTKISLHLFFEKKKFKYCPDLIMKNLKRKNSSTLLKYQRKLSIIQKFPTFFTIYPINVARNIGRIGKRTKLFLSSDIENYTSLNYESKILSLVSRVLLKEKQKLVLVHRRFEVDNNVSLPINKETLKQLYHKRKAIQFHGWFFAKAHAIPNLKQWLESEENFNETKIGFFFENPSALWEPQFVGDERVPFHDERFLYRSRSNTHLARILCFQEFKFAIMDDVFTVHKGIKKRLNYHERVALTYSHRSLKNLLKAFNKNLEEAYPHMKNKCKKSRK